MKINVSFTKREAIDLAKNSISETFSPYDIGEINVEDDVSPIPPNVSLTSPAVARANLIQLIKLVRAIAFEYRNGHELDLVSVAGAKKYVENHFKINNPYPEV